MKVWSDKISPYVLIYDVIIITMNKQNQKWKSAPCFHLCHLWKVQREYNYKFYFLLFRAFNAFSQFFFSEVGPNWDLRTQARWPIALYLSFKFIGLFRSHAPLPRATIPLSLASFICSGSILAKPKVCILTFSNTGHSHRMCADVSFPAPHLLHERVFALLILCSMYCRLIWPVRSPTNILQYVLSSLLMNWTYRVTRRRCPYFFL